MDELNQGPQRGMSMHRGGPGRMVVGVCLALARQTGFQVGWVRIAFVLALLFSGGSALLVYTLLWGLTPASAHGRTPVQRVLGVAERLTGAGESRWERRV